MRINKVLMENLDDLAQKCVTAIPEFKRDYERTAYNLIETLEPKYNWQFYHSEFKSRQEWYSRHPNLRR